MPASTTPPPPSTTEAHPFSAAPATPAPPCPWCACSFLFFLRIASEPGLSLSTVQWQLHRVWRLVIDNECVLSPVKRTCKRTVLPPIYVAHVLLLLEAGATAAVICLLQVGHDGGGDHHGGKLPARVAKVHTVALDLIAVGRKRVPVCTTGSATHTRAPPRHGSRPHHATRATARRPRCCFVGTNLTDKLMCRRVRAVCG